MKKHSAEKHSRSLIKSISYRLISMTADTIAAYLLTHDTAMTIGLVVLVNTYSTVLYYIHERVWANIHWGRKKGEEN